MDLPLAVINSIKKFLPNEVDDFIKSFSVEVPVSIRWNKRKQQANKIQSKVPWATTSEYLKERKSFTLDPVFHSGAYYVQEASSIFLEFILENIVIEKVDLKVLDACASPGGKSTILSTWLGNDGILVSNEIVKHRANILLENLTKWGIGNHIVTSNDPRSFLKLNSIFDLILVDAPCSGEGMFRKDPNAIKEWSEQQVIVCANRQKEILSNLIPSLKSDGYLIYSTCTFNEKENEDIVDWIINEFDFISAPQLDIDESWGIVNTKNNSVSCYRFFPHRVKGEGLFYCILQKKSSNNPTTQRKKDKKKVSLNLGLSQFSNWIMDTINLEFKLENNVVKALPFGMLDLKEILEKHLFIMDYGVSIAEIKGKDYIPQHALALYYNNNKENFNCIEVSKEKALKYLSKETFPIENKNSGWYLVLYENYPLGWCKITNGRMNNYYPKEWKIRMKLNSHDS